MSANSGNKWEYSGKLENESGASLYFAVGEEPRAKFARFNVIVEENTDKSKTKKKSSGDLFILQRLKQESTTVMMHRLMS